MKYFCLLLFAISISLTYGQNSVSGKITEAETSAPLEQVSVYFPQLERGAVTNTEGFFELANLPLGSYKLLVSYIGYQTFSKTIEITAGNSTIEVQLTPSAIEMEEVIVSTPFHKLQRENVMKVEQAKIADLKTQGAITLADGITNIAGVETVSTGVGIGKPVIRGLSSNRVLVYTQGIRLENQQFGDEHGLGIGDAGIESVEVIKGPASLLYGSDAMGGVLYLNPERFALTNRSAGEVNLNYFSNTAGLGSNLGYKTSGKHFKFLVRGGHTTHTDYKGGNGLRVTNSRFREYDLKTGLGYQAGILKTEFRYNYNASELGIPEEIGIQTRDRTPTLPYQELHNHILSSATDIFFNRSSLKITLGYIFNDRKEFEEHLEEGMEEEEEEEEEGAALDMHLSTFNYNLLYNLPKGKLLETIVGIQGMRQTNKNFGEEVLIPDATTSDIGILATSHLHFDKSDMQFGIRYDHRAIAGEENGTAGMEGYIAPIDRDFNSFNAAAGYRIDVSDKIIGRINLASGFRAPNLAELTSNGVHEGTNRFEIGNPDLNNEKNLQADIALEYKNQHLEFYLNGFYNSIKDYIFIAPNGQFVDQDAVFLYRQQNANLYGGEIVFHLHPHPLDWLHLETSFETVIGKLDNGDYLPLIPANKLKNTLRIEFEEKDNWLQKSYAFLSVQSVFTQNNFSEFETKTDSYNLLNIGLGGNFSLFKQDAEIRISGNNMLDQNYIAHLSRLKTDGIANIGRNISVGLTLKI